MWEFDFKKLGESFGRFERAAAKGHEESIWISSVLKDMEMEWGAVKEAFAKTEEPLGWYFAGELSEEDSREELDFYKKSVEGGCSWGQADFGWYFKDGLFVEQDEKVYVEWLEKAANQNNPQAMHLLGEWLRNNVGDKQKALSYFRVASELGWKISMEWLGYMLERGEGCEKDLRQAAIWSAKAGEGDVFWDLLEAAKRALGSGATEELDCDFNQLCYSLGWGLYWYLYDSEDWNHRSNEDQVFVNRCLDYYCSCLELQQKSIFTFLWCWNRTTGVKGPGQIIGQMVWEQRDDNLVIPFDQNNGGEEPEMKRIKK
jgi:hypothetical protein